MTKVWNLGDSIFAFGEGSRLAKENRLQDTIRNIFDTGMQKDSFKNNPNTLHYEQDPDIYQEDKKLLVFFVG